MVWNHEQTNSAILVLEISVKNPIRTLGAVCTCIHPENLVARVDGIQVNQVDVPPNEELILTLRRERPGCYICMDGLVIS